MVYDVRVARQAEKLLAELAGRDRRRVRELALLLLSLRKDPRPAGSRELQPPGDPVAGGRVWLYPPFDITYQVDEKRKRVNVALIRVHEPPSTSA